MKPSEIQSDLVLPNPSASLYERILGETWTNLNSSLQMVHATSHAIRLTGVFRFRRSDRMIARLILAAMGIPDSCSNLPTELTVDAVGKSEQWKRRFGGKTLITLQFVGPTGLLHERVGIFELTFRVRVSEGALLYQQTGAVLRVLGLSFPIPKYLSPRVQACEEAIDTSAVSVFVVVTAPLLGFLFSYEGTVHADI